MNEKAIEAAKALRYLADHPRPIGGQQRYNAEHLISLADELSAPPLRAREEIARVIDEWAWRICTSDDQDPRSTEILKRWDDALAKADAVLALSRTAGQEWRDISSAPSYSSSDARVWVIGGRYTKPAAVVPDGEYWRAMKGELKLLPTHWAPADPPPFPAPPVVEPIVAEKSEVKS